MVDVQRHPEGQQGRHEGSGTSVFPTFSDGDVLICLSPTVTYKLHSSILRQHSRLLRDMLQKEAATKLSAQSRREGVAIQYRLEYLSTDECRNHNIPVQDDNDAGILVSRELDNRGRRIGPSQWGSDCSLNSGVYPGKLHDINIDYDNVFRSLYNLPIHINGDTMFSVLQSLWGLAMVAEYLQCISAITHQVDHKLARFGQRLWVAVAANPAEWADVGLRLRSESVFQEAICHLVGRWPRMTYIANRTRHCYPGGETALEADEAYCEAVGLKSPRTVPVGDERSKPALNLSEDNALRIFSTIRSMRPEIRTLVQAKHQALEAAKRSVNSRIMGYYPTFFARAGGGTSFAARRTTIGDAISWAGQHMAGAGISGPDPDAQGLAVGRGSRTTSNTGTSVRMSTYGKEVMGWMALTLIRHWFGQRVVMLQPNTLIDGGWKYYKAIHAGGDAYLGFDEVESFTSWFPLSGKARRQLEEQLDSIKKELKHYVKDLMTNRLELDPPRAGDAVREEMGGQENLFGPHSGVAFTGDGQLRIKYLVCTEVKRDEFPWVLAAKLEAKQKRGLSSVSDREAAMEEDEETLFIP